MKSSLIVFVLAFSLAAAACSSAVADPPPGSAPVATTTPGDTTAAAPVTTSAAEATTSTAAVAPESPPLVTMAPDEPICDDLQGVEMIGQISDEALVEISGIAASRTHPVVIWAHNDSGDEAVVYALATDGTLLSTHRLDEAFPLDWEDISLGPGPDPSSDYLYIGDIGDNLNFRPNILVYRIPEPDPFTDGEVAHIEQILLAYPEPGINAEALTVDPVTGDLFVFAKTRSDPVTMYRARAEMLTGEQPVPLELVGIVGIAEGSEVTAADISASGDRIALRGYREVWVWPRSEPDIAAVLQTEPCDAASPDEVQGEALTFSADGITILTVSEGSGVAVNRVGAS